MRTTITLDESVFELAKRQAQARNQTLSRFVQAAVQAELAKTDSEPVGFDLVTWGARDARPPSADEIRLSLDDEDAARFEPPQR